MKQGRYRVENKLDERTISVELSGPINAEAMKSFAEEYKQATDEYERGPHLILADMRGLLPLDGPVAEIMGEAIEYGRAHGAYKCVHLSESAILRLQASRLARRATPDDTVTIEVVSLEEAKRVLDEERARLLKRGT